MSVAPQVFHLCSWDRAELEQLQHLMNQEKCFILTKYEQKACCGRVKINIISMSKYFDGSMGTVILH